MANKYKNTLNDMDRLWIDHNPDMSIDDLSKKLKTVANAIRTYKDTPKAAPEHITTTKKSPARNRFAKKGGAIVMTEAQSQIGDSSKSSRPEYMKSCVHTFDTKDND
jgi:hypothetical protein